eukprot:353886-Chlamydomonas_euryale.AAC.2
MAEGRTSPGSHRPSSALPSALSSLASEDALRDRCASSAEPLSPRSAAASASAAATAAAATAAGPAAAAVKVSMAPLPFRGPSGARLFRRRRSATTSRSRHHCAFIFREKAFFARTSARRVAEGGEECWRGRGRSWRVGKPVAASSSEREPSHVGGGGPGSGAATMDASGKARARAAAGREAWEGVRRRPLWGRRRWASDGSDVAGGCVAAAEPSRDEADSHATVRCTPRGCNRRRGLAPTNSVVAKFENGRTARYVLPSRRPAYATALVPIPQAATSTPRIHCPHPQVGADGRHSQQHAHKRCRLLPEFTTHSALCYVTRSWRGHGQQWAWTRQTVPCSGF